MRVFCRIKSIVKGFYEKRCSSLFPLKNLCANLHILDNLEQNLNSIKFKRVQLAYYRAPKFSKKKYALNPLPNLLIIKIQKFMMEKDTDTSLQNKKARLVTKRNGA